MAEQFDDVVLSGDGLELRPLTEADIDPIFRACQDQVTLTWLPMPLPYTREVAEHFVTRMAPDRLTSGAGIIRAVVLDGEFAGCIDLKNTSWRAQCTEIGYWVAPWSRGHGIAGRASRVLADWALTQQRMERVEIRAAIGNVASQKAALAAGFQREGVLRNAGFIHGGRVDLVVFGKTPQELAPVSKAVSMLS